MDTKETLKKYRATKEWKENRKKFLEKHPKCKWCDSTNKLAPHHKTNYGLNISKYLMKQKNNIINIGLKNKLFFQFKNKNEDYINQYKYLITKKQIRLIIKNNPKLFLNLLQEAKKEAFEEYKSLKDCITLCNKCHFAIHKGMVLCEKCKKKYHKINYSTCWNCKPTEEEEAEEIKKAILSYPKYVREAFIKKFGREMDLDDTFELGFGGGGDWIYEGEVICKEKNKNDGQNWANRGYE